MFSAGFEEVAEGKRLARDLKIVADRYGIAVLGANCVGAWSVRDSAILTFSGSGLQLGKLVHGPVAIVTQSGALGGGIALHLQSQQIGCAYMISVGNETQLDILDYLSWVIEQDDVEVAVLYIEGFDDGVRLLEIAERARERGVQIIALKAGRSLLGQSATASHTGKIASAHRIYQHVLEQAGVIALDSVADVLAAIETLLCLPSPRVSSDPQGGVAAISISGGACALLADHSEQFGVPMATFSADTQSALDELFPSFGRSQNPADMTGQLRSQPTLMDESVALISADPRCEAFIMQFSSSGVRDMNEKGHIFTACAREQRLPVIVSLAGEPVPFEVHQKFRTEGVLFRGDPAATMRSLCWLYQRDAYTRRARLKARRPLARATAPRSWPQTVELLRRCGIDSPKFAILQAGERAAQRCADMKLPLVVKVLPEDAEHKTELGLIALRVQSFADVDAHAARFREILAAPRAGILVQEMVPSGVEVLLAGLRNTDFGPVLTIGLGGVGLELFQDVAHLALPVHAVEVERALTRLKLWQLLQGFRGAGRADIESLVQAAVAFGDLFLALPDVAEFEINPLLVMTEGLGVSAVDTLVARVEES